MAQSASSHHKIPTKDPQPAHARAVQAAPAKARSGRSAGRSSARVSGETREATRGTQPYLAGAARRPCRRHARKPQCRLDPRAGCCLISLSS